MMQTRDVVLAIYEAELDELMSEAERDAEILLKEAGANEEQMDRFMTLQRDQLAKVKANSIVRMRRKLSEPDAPGGLQ